MTEIKVGDVVTYRPKATRPDFQPMGIAGCEVEMIDQPSVVPGQSCAMIAVRLGGKEERWMVHADCLTKD